MQLGSADAENFCTAFRAGPGNDSAAALVETSDGILNLTLRLALYTITFHFFLQKIVLLSHALFSVYHLKTGNPKFNRVNKRGIIRKPGSSNYNE